MKFAKRFSPFLSLLLLMMFNTSGSHRAAPAPPEKIIDPVCVAICAFEAQECFRSEKGNNGRCLGVYRHCVAQCGKN